MAVGSPKAIIDEIVRQGKRDLTVIAHDTVMPSTRISTLICAMLVKEVVASNIGLNREAQRQMMDDSLIVDLVPHSLAPRGK